MSGLSAAILGAGFMGKSHAKCLQQIEGVEIAAVCALTAREVASLNQEVGCNAAVYTDFGKMLAGEKIDLLFVCIPPFAHNGEVEKAAAKGIHLFLEKPIALTVEAAESMTDAIEAADLVSQVGFHFRFKKSVQRLKEMIEKGDAGKPTLFEARYWTNMDGSNWWRNQSLSGGQIYEQATHFYDLACFLLGTPRQISAMTADLCHQSDESYTIEDTSLGMIGFENGAMASVSASNNAVEMNFIGDFRAVFEHVVLEYRCTGQPWVTADTSTLRFSGDAQEQFTEDEDAYLLEVEEFIGAIRNDGRTTTPVRDGLNAVILAHAALQSSSSGKTVILGQ